MKGNKLKSLIFAIALTMTATAVPFLKVSAASTPITRSQAEQRALNMINLNWTYSSDKNGNLSANYTPFVTQPAQLKGVTTAEEVGIPYDWGGQDGLDSHSINEPWTNFKDAINQGAFAGNVNTDAGYGYIQTTAGIDCSGFIQATFNIQDYKISTSTMFDKYFTKINVSDLKHMDILDRPGDHVVIFDHWGTQNGVSGAYTYESTPDQAFGGIQGTKKYFMTMTDLNNGYIPGRFINIVEDTQTSTTGQTSTGTSSTTTTPTSDTSTTPTTSVPKPVNPGTFAQIANVNYAANFRSSSSLTATIIGTVPKGTIAYLIDYSNGWYQLKYNGQIGWVWGANIAAIPSGKYVTVNGVSQLNIRSNPNDGYILGTISQNQYAQVLGYNSDKSWMQISINGIQGWAYAQYLSYIY